jgi:hypothetical protein
LTGSRRDENANKEGEATQCSNLLGYNQRQNLAKKLLLVTGWFESLIKQLMMRYGVVVFDGC